MRVNFNPNINSRKKKITTPIKGAIEAAVIYSTANAIGHISNPQQLKNTIKSYGGKMNYFKNYLLGLGISSICGAAIFSAANHICSKIKSKDSPTAVN